MFKDFDGTGRTPRKEQLEFLQFISENWHNSLVLAGTLACGVGKSAILRSVMLEHNATAITANNLLISEMSKAYPTMNYLIGKSHYMCAKNKDQTCEDMWKLKTHKNCGECAYSRSRHRALYGKEPTLYNAISYFYAQQDPKWTIPDVLIVDEADKLIEMLMLLVGETFGRNYKPPQGMDLMQVSDWLKEKERELGVITTHAKTVRDAVIYQNKFDKVSRIRDGIITKPEEYAHAYNEKNELVVFPIKPPAMLFDQLLRAKKLILMSATLYEEDIRKLTRRPYKHVEVGNPVDEARRRIVVKASPEPFNASTEPSAIAAWISKVLNEYPKRNTLIHVTYDMGVKLKRFFPDFLINTKDDKANVLETFKKKGGIWLAAGCAEGIDLPDNICTLNIIPVLPRPNIGDPVIRKRLSLPNGDDEYNIGVVKQVQQMAGRSTRHSEDYSLTVVSDKRFIDLVKKYRARLPRSFIEQIKRG